MALRVLSSFAQLFGGSVERPAPALGRPQNDRPIRSVAEGRTSPEDETGILPWVSDPAEAWREFERLLEQARRQRGSDGTDQAH